MVLCQGAEVKLDLLKREAETIGLNMHGNDGGCLSLPQAAAVAAAASGAVDEEPAAEDYDSNYDNDSIIGAVESSSERAEI